MLSMIIKRDGREVAFDRVKIADAIYKAAQVLGGNDREMAQDLAQKVEDYVEATIQGRTPTVEQIQDAVEQNPHRKRPMRQHRQGIHPVPQQSAPGCGR